MSRLVQIANKLCQSANSTKSDYLFDRYGVMCFEKDFDYKGNRLKLDLLENDWSCKEEPKEDCPQVKYVDLNFNCRTCLNK